VRSNSVGVALCEWGIGLLHISQVICEKAEHYVQGRGSCDIVKLKGPVVIVQCLW